MSGFPPGRYYMLVANADGARAAVDRNAAISQMRRQAIESNIGEPAMLFIAVPSGTEDEAAALVKAALDSPDDEGGEA